jgi:TRAP-type C4-dicarboxylate transport system permease small subunit
MKILKTLILLFLLAVVFSAVVYAMTSGTITATWTDIIGEVTVVAVPVFVFFFFIYIIAKAVGKTVKKGNKKSLPGQEGTL